MSEAKKREKEMKSNVLVTAKIRKLLLRLELWGIYEQIFLRDDASTREKEGKGTRNKNREAGQLLEQVLQGQEHAQQGIAKIFSTDSVIQNWESVLSKLQVFEQEADTIPFVTTDDVKIPLTEVTVKVSTSEDHLVTEVVINMITDPYQLACEIQLEYGLPPDEIDYIQGLLQHEMLELLRQGMTDQREKLRSIQKKTAIIEHLVMLNENISSKFAKTKKMYDTSSDHLKGPATTPIFASPSSRTSSSSKSRTLVHFNKLIIDERRKLSQIEQEIASIFKKLGKMGFDDYYKPKGNIPIFTNGKDILKLSKSSVKDKRSSNPSNNLAPNSGSGRRRASVSLRSALMQQPLQVSGTLSLNEEDEDNEECDSFETSKNTHSSSKKLFNNEIKPEDDEEDMNTFGLSDHEIEKKMLYKKSEKDRTELIAENKRLREIINSMDMVAVSHGESSPETDSKNSGGSFKESLEEDTDLRALINELNAWDIERDELDGQIDGLNDKIDDLKRKLLKQKVKKEQRQADIAEFQLSLMTSS